MDNELDLPAERPMPDDLQDEMWNRLRPQVADILAGKRRRSLARPLSVAAAVGALVVGGVVVPGSAPQPVVPAAPPADAQAAHDCVTATIASGVDVPDPDSWRPGVRMDVGIGAWPEFLVIRNDKAAAVCLTSYRTAGGITGADPDFLAGRGRHNYANLTPARPFDYLGSWNFNADIGRSIQFGIATDDVVAVSIVGANNVITPALLHDGTFAAEINNGELCGTPPDPNATPETSDQVRATLKNGQIVEGPLCVPVK